MMNLEPGRREHPYRSRPVGAMIDWLTPPDIIRALGEFDLDPCASVFPQPWATAKQMWSPPMDGLSEPWFGRVWCNPPFGSETAKWLECCARHGNAIALVFARTETKMFFDSVWGRASGILFLRGRPHFHYPSGRRAKGNSGGPIVLIAYGGSNLAGLIASGLDGAVIAL